MKPFVLIVSLIVALVGLTPAFASDEASPDSPRAALARYLELARAGRFQDAAGFLDLPPSLADRGPSLARRLKAVLDRHAWLDLEAVSAAPEGDLTDDLPPAQEQIATIPVASGIAEPVRLARTSDAADARWRFSRSTVERVDGWYQALPNHWILEHLPAPLLRPGPGELMWWQWIALPILLLAAWIIGYTLGRLTRAVLGRLAARTATRWDDTVLSLVGGPITLAWTLGATYVLLPWLGLYSPAAALVHRLLRAAFFLIVFWSLLRTVDIAKQIIAESPWASARPGSRPLIALGARVAKVVVLAMAIIAVLAEFGFPVASLVAGLGIGGLALALAAQKTVENLFGAFSIGVDQPFREGDFVKIEDFVGTVEAVGLRSTRIRTLDRTLISIPNGRLADMRIESFTARDRMRLACTIGLVYGTTATQMRAVLEGLEQVLRAHPKIWTDSLVVRFKALAAYSLDIEVMAWFTTSEWSDFQLIRQEILVGFMDVVEQAGTSFAFPTQTVHVSSERPLDK